jgi:hypothetical protein
MRIDEEDLAAGAYVADLWWRTMRTPGGPVKLWADLSATQQERWRRVARAVTGDVLQLVVGRLNTAIVDATALTGQRDRPRSYDEGVTDALHVLAEVAREIRERAAD